MSSNPFIPALLSLLVPGLGQMLLGHGQRGAAILLAVIFGGNLNAVWLTLDSTAEHERGFFWTDKLPRILHDWFAAYGVLFWLWQVADAAQLAREKGQVAKGQENGVRIAPSLERCCPPCCPRDDVA